MYEASHIALKTGTVTTPWCYLRPTVVSLLQKLSQFSDLNPHACLVRIWLDQEDNRKHFDRIIFCVFLESEQACYEQLLPLYFPHPGTPYTPLPEDELKLEVTEEVEEDEEESDSEVGQTNEPFCAFVFHFMPCESYRHFFSKDR